MSRRVAVSLPDLDSPERIRAFIDYMTAHIRGLDLDVTGHWAKTAQAANAGEHAHGAVPVAA